MTTKQVVEGTTADSDALDILKNYIQPKFTFPRVTDGLDLTPDYGVPEVTISSGTVVRETGNSILEHNVEQATVELTDNTTNYIYLAQQRSELAYVVLESEENVAGGVLIAEIDTTNDVALKKNRTLDTRLDSIKSLKIVSEDQGDDIFDAINKVLEQAGEDSYVFVEPGKYTKANGNPVSTQLTTWASGQSIEFLGADVELADGVDVDMIEIQHDGCEIKDVDIDGNITNNADPNGITTASGLGDILLEDVEFYNLDRGIDLVDVTDSTLRHCRAGDGASNVNEAIHAEGCNGLQVVETTVPEFNEIGLHFRDCFDVVGVANVVRAGADATAEAGLKVTGCRQCRFSATIDGDGNMTNGWVSEPYDPGGANEQTSTNNRFEVDVSGADERGFYINSSEVERVESNIIGTYDGGRTQQAFEIADTHGIVDNPAHEINVDITGCDRFSDSSITSGNAGTVIRGHVTKLQSTCDYTMGGRSITDMTFGVALPNPVINVGGNTAITYSQSTKKTTTGAGGQINVDWSNFFHFTDRPVLNVSLEDNGRQWYVTSYGTDGSGRYTDATIQVTDSSGTAVGSNQQANVKVLGT